ncbi:MAG: Autolytic lysozyme [Pelotomaculum sp. PtaB.Bin104]|nr:MAG: Autolytic lysozyme [Pelotomaculum sp. PtaB.Bin104]
MKLKGIDVSEHQGTIAWEKLKGQVDFVIIRSSHGMNEMDTQWEQNYAGAKRAGIPAGAYHYFYYGDRTKNQKEVDNFLSKLVGKSLEYPAFIDFEECDPKFRPPLGALPKDQITDYALYALGRIRDAGFMPGIYANKHWLTNHLDADQLPGDVIIWLAQYNSSPTYSGRYDLWQYTDKGHMDGVMSSGLDLNYCFKTFAPGIASPAPGPPSTDTHTGLARSSEKCPYPEPSYTIPHRKNITGDAARWFQWHLLRAGYDCGVNKAAADKYGTDGFAYAKTWDAIEAVTRKAGLGIGDAGQKTRETIKEANNL